MKPRAMRLSSLSRIEQQLLACIRAACFPAEAPACRSDFQICNAVNLIADQLAETQLSIWHPNAMFLSRDELLLLTSLAAMQRRSCRTMRCALDPGLMEALRKCAAALTEAGVRMPIKAVTRLDMIVQPKRHPIEAPRSNAHPRNSALYIRDGSIGATAHAMVHEQKFVSTREFEAAGISRQYLSLLCKKGYLRRIRHGWYGACQD